MTENPEAAILTKKAIQLTKEGKPRDLEQLATLVAEETSIPREAIIEHLLRLQSQGRIKLKTPRLTPPENLSNYLTTVDAHWYWITLFLTILITIAAFATPETAYPLIYVRYGLGAILVLWLPGYSFARALFPTVPSTRSLKENLDSVERMALSIGMSLALAPIVGLLLNYTPWGISLTPLTLSLSALTLIFATTALIREHRVKAKAYPAE